MNISLTSKILRFRPFRRDRRAPTSTPRWHSVSSSREYEGCPRRYRFGYLDRRPHDRPSPPSWRFGSVVHEGLEAAYRQMAEGLTAPGAHRSAAAAAVHESWGRHGLGADARGRDRAVWIVTRALAKDVLTVGDILGVEVPLRGAISADERVIGFADLVLERGKATIEIVDHKVTRYRATPEALREDFQLNLYGHLARLRWPHVERVLGTHHYPMGPDVVRTDLDPDLMSAAFERLRSNATTIAEDRNFVPIPSERCGHCPWQPSCPEGTTHLQSVVGSDAADLPTS